MQAESLKRTVTGRYGLVAAVFTDCAHANDAVADLSREGFSAQRIGVAFPTKGLGTAGQKEAASVHHDLGEQHSFIWRLRRNFEHDLHRRGESQLAGSSKGGKDESAGHPYSEVNLWEALGALGLPDDSIQLINREMTEKGAFIIVDGDKQWQAAEAVLVRNSGVIRTDAVTNQMPSPRVTVGPGSIGHAADSFDDN